MTKAFSIIDEIKKETLIANKKLLKEKIAEYYAHAQKLTADTERQEKFLAELIEVYESDDFEKIKEKADYLAQFGGRR